MSKLLVLLALLRRRSFARASLTVPDIERVGHLGRHIHAVGKQNSADELYKRQGRTASTVGWEDPSASRPDC